MKATGKCPKCGSTDIFIRKPKKGEYRGIPLGWTAETPETYICKQCGYIEEYFVDYQIEKLH